MQENVSSIMSYQTKNSEFDLSAYCCQHYKQAILTLILANSLEGSDSKRLIFGAIELVPHYLCCQTISYNQQNKTSELSIKRLTITVKQALAIYKNASDTGSITIPGIEGQLQIFDKSIPVDALVSCPKYGKTTFNKKIPFISDTYQFEGAQVCHLMPLYRANYLEQFVADRQHYTYLNKSDKRLLLSIVKNLEYVGSFNLVLPNPFFSKSEIRLDMSSNHICSDTVVFTTDKDCSGKNLKLILVEKSNGEYGGMQVLSLEESTCRIHLSWIGDQVEYSVIDEYGRILSRNEFTPFIRGVKTNLHIDGQRVRVISKSLGGGVFSRKHHNSIENLSSSNECNPYKLILKLDAIRDERNSIMKAASRHFFYSNQHAAVSFIQKIVNRAKKEILLIDPYISSRTINWYVPITNYDVQIDILCTNKNWVSCKNPMLQYEKLKKQIQKLCNLGYKINVSLVRSADLHDRFVCIDGQETWLVGASLDKSNGKLTTIVKLQDGQGAAKYLRTYSKKVFWQRLEEWTIDNL